MSCEEHGGMCTNYGHEDRFAEPREPRTIAGRKFVRVAALIGSRAEVLRTVLAIEDEAARAAYEDGKLVQAELIRLRIKDIDHPCHDVCVGNLHADCQCAAWVRQEAIAAAKDD